MLLVFNSVFVPILTCGHESLVTTERILSKEHTAEMGFLRRVLGVTLRDKVYRSEIRKAQDLIPPACQVTSPNREIPAMLVRPGIQNPQERRRTNSFGLQFEPTGKWPRVRPRTRWCDYISDLAWSRLGVEPAELAEIAVDREVFRVILGCCPRASVQRKRCQKAQTKNSLFKKF